MRNNGSRPWLDGLKCPNCLKNLTYGLHDNVCNRCGYKIETVDGILNFASSSNVNGAQDDKRVDGNLTWPNEVSPSTFNAIIESAKSEHWFQAIRKHLPDSHELMMSMVDTTRLAWLFHCYRESASGAALVLGSQWGTLPLMLSDYYETVYSVHENLACLRFQAERAAADGIDNLVLMRSGMSTLPLESNSIDMIVLNGLPSGATDDTPNREKSAAFYILLEELHRILSPSGTLYIGAENRYSPLKLINRKQSGRLTYAHWGYRQVLKNAGFKHLSAYWSWPSHNFSRMSGPFDGIGMKYLASKQKEHLAAAWMRLAVSFFTKLPAALIGLGAKLAMPSFILIATKNEAPTESLQSQALARSADIDSYVRLTLSQDARLRTTFLLLKDGVVSKAVRVSAGDHSAATGKEGESAQSAICKSVRPFQFDESAGVEGRLFRPASKQDITAAGRWLRAYQASTAQGEWCVANLEAEINQVTSTIAPILESKSLDASVDAFVSSYLNAIQERSIPITAEHGDFTLPNLMFSPDDEIQVIDWEHSRQQGHPFMDLGSLCLSFLRRGENSTSMMELSAESAIGWFLEGFSTEATPNSAQHGLLENSSIVRLPVALAPAYYVMRVMHRIVSYQPLSAPATYLELQDTWLPLLTLAIDYHKQHRLTDAIPNGAV